MPKAETIRRAQHDKEQGKSASTQAGEFVREVIDDIRQGKHGARSTKQAIAIGLSEARRAGVDLPPPKKGKVTEKTRKSAASALAHGQSEAAGEIHQPKVSATRSRATQRAARARRHDRRLARSLVAANSLGRETSHRERALDRRGQSRANKGPRHARPRAPPQSRKNSCPAQAKAAKKSSREKTPLAATLASRRSIVLASIPLRRVYFDCGISHFADDFARQFSS